MDVLITITDEEIPHLERALATTREIGAVNTSRTFHWLLERIYAARASQSPDHRSPCGCPEHHPGVTAATRDFVRGVAESL